MSALEVGPPYPILTRLGLSGVRVTHRVVVQTREWQWTLDGQAVAEPAREPLGAESAPVGELSSASVARFRARIVPTPGCFLFVGAVDSHGYGVVRVATSSSSGRRSWSAHRLAASLAGLVPGPSEVLQHGCNEPLCCRVGDGHLTVGSQGENVRYAVACGRHRGSRPAHPDPRGPLARSRAIRAALNPALASESAQHALWPPYDPAALAAARDGNPQQLSLFALPQQHAHQARVTTGCGSSRGGSGSAASCGCSDPPTRHAHPTVFLRSAASNVQ